MNEKKRPLIVKILTSFIAIWLALNCTQCILG